MKVNRVIILVFIMVTLFASTILKENSLLPFLIPIVFAHCDTVDGPVVKDAKLALEKGDVAPVLKWVEAERETEVRAAFNKALIERKDAQAKEEADMEFFQTLVRIHREAEGAPFTGLKPAGTDLEPAVREADNALETGSVDVLIKLATDELTKGIRERFMHALEKKKHKDESVEAGREFVEAYVEFIHYVEERVAESKKAEPEAHHMH